MKRDGIRMCFVCLTRHRKSEECKTMTAIKNGPGNSEQRAVCTSCNNQILPATCYCGMTMVKHTVEDKHAPVPMGCTCDHLRPVGDVLNVVEEQVLRMGVSSNIWVGHIQATMLLLVDVVKSQQKDIKQLKAEALVKCKGCGRVRRGEEKKCCPLPKLPDADYDGIEEAYRTPPGTGKQTTDRNNRGPLFRETEPPPRDKETTLFQPKPLPTCPVCKGWVHHDRAADVFYHNSGRCELNGKYESHAKWVVAVATHTVCKQCGKLPALYRPLGHMDDENGMLDCETCNPKSPWTKRTPAEWVEKNSEVLTV